MLWRCSVTLKAGTSRIFHGAFSDSIGLRRYISENSIWEKEILELIPEADREEKYLAELRFYNFLRHMPRGRRHAYFLAAKLRFLPRGVSPVDVLHRMYYIYTPDGDALSHALCLYGPQAFDFSRQECCGKFRYRSASSSDIRFRRQYPVQAGKTGA